jgi:hypothetical protein
VRLRNQSLAKLSFAVALAVAGAGCSLFRHKPAKATAAASPSASATPSLTAEAEATPAPPASIQISYADPKDALRSVTVRSFTGANVLLTRRQGDDQSTVVRFDGGVPVWSFHSGRSLLNPLSGLGSKRYRIAKVDYGKVPDGFTQDIPEEGPPAPLDPGSYYIFEIERGSGAVSYQAVRLAADGSLQAYDAEPRAGTSYKLCCNVSSDFAEPSPAQLGPGPVLPSDSDDEP